MKLVDHQAKSPEENIALDEMLLLKAEAGKEGETLRVWESPEYFVVLGRGSKLSEDCFRDACVRDRIKIIRRISGGGTILQGPGCLNFSLILSYSRETVYSKIRDSYEHILSQISDEFAKEGCDTAVCPLSDIAFNGKKISGNAQARKRSFFLHHGTILYDFDIKKISVYLKHPSSEPRYREKRLHQEFLTNISVTSGTLETLIKCVFLRKDQMLWHPAEKDIQELDRLTSVKYTEDKWNIEGSPA